MTLFVLGCAIGAIMGAILYSLVVALRRPDKKEWDGPFYERDNHDDIP